MNSSSGRSWSSDTYNPCPEVEMPGVPSSRFSPSPIQHREPETQWCTAQVKTKPEEEEEEEKGEEEEEEKEKEKEEEEAGIKRRWISPN